MAQMSFTGKVSTQIIHLEVSHSIEFLGCWFSLSRAINVFCVLCGSYRQTDSHTLNYSFQHREVPSAFCALVFSL